MQQSLCDGFNSTASRTEDPVSKLEKMREEEMKLLEWTTFNQWLATCATYAKHNVTGGKCAGALKQFDKPPPVLPTDCACHLYKRDLDGFMLK